MNSLSYSPFPVLTSSLTQGEDAVFHFARSRRARRAAEWSDAKAVTFIVTLAESRSVTLAAARAGMSRKAAYALRRRDSGFAAAWATAIRAPLPPRQPVARRRPIVGDKAGDVYTPRISARKGYSVPLNWDAWLDAQMRDYFFSELANRPTSLARDGGLP